MGVEVSHYYRRVFTGFAGRLPQVGAVGTARSRPPEVVVVADDPLVAMAAQTLPAGVDRVETDRYAGARIDGQEAPPVDAGIAVLDSGIDRDHPELNVTGGVNCVTPAPATTTTTGTAPTSPGSPPPRTTGPGSSASPPAPASTQSRFWTARIATVRPRP
jgi:hypothetical protein